MARTGRRAFLALALAVFAPAAAAATTIGYWRMEADLDPSANGLEVANEEAGSPLLSSEAFVDTLANPNGTVPQTGSSNFGSVGATFQGGGNGINGTVAWYPALDVSSISVELWARTVENTATLFSRSAGGADGIVLANPNSLTLTYYVDDGAGGSTGITLSGLDDMSGTWAHYAFVYDEFTGVGSFYVDEVLVASNDGPDARPLFWGTQVDLSIGVQMDYAAAFNGTMDEFRIDDGALPPTSFLSAPEPSSFLLVSLGLGALLCLRAHRAR
jgi:hypothetical protein